jgi:hypothetical protein
MSGHTLWKTVVERQPEEGKTSEVPLKHMMNLLRLWYLKTENKVPVLRTLVF